jgi:hypothetical protein
LSRPSRHLVLGLALRGLLKSSIWLLLAVRLEEQALLEEVVLVVSAQGLVWP